MSRAAMTPLQLRMLLDVFVSPEPIDLANNTRREQFIAMVRDDLIEAHERDSVEGLQYRCTERGRAFVAALLQMPYPTRRVTWRVRHDFEESEEELYFGG